MTILWPPFVGWMFFCSLLFRILSRTRVISKLELDDDYSKALFDMSSLLPERYNTDIARCLNDTREGRHVAMGVNADASTLIKLMDIGTPTNINQNK